MSISGNKLMSDFNFISKYAKYRPELQRRETFEESVDRTMRMHLEKYTPNLLDTPATSISGDTREETIARYIHFAFDMVKEKKLLASQRALQFGGAGVKKHNMRMYNCLSQDTAFITDLGVRTFADFSDGDSLFVLSHKGRFLPAKVRSYGEQKLRKIFFNRKKAKHVVWATDNHRWLLADGTITTNLKSGMQVLHAPNVSSFDYDQAPSDERLYWAYGYVFGDGTLVKNANGQYSSSMVRLCGPDSIKYRGRFEELGFPTSTSHSLEGDYIAFTGHYLKTVPDPSIDEWRLIKAWVHGYLAADGEKDLNFGRTSKNQYRTIQCSDPNAIEAIRNLFPMCGFYIVSEEDLTGQVTNFGTRPYTIKFRLRNSFGANNRFIAELTEETKTEEVWCLEVEEDESFVLPFGLSTGNCAVSYCDRPRFFAEAFYMLLCGCGVGFSVQKHHVAKLPELTTNIGPRPEQLDFYVEDTIEGWAEVLDCLINSYLEGTYESRIDWTFKFDLIRPEGASLSTGGSAPGPQPLKNALRKIKGVLESAVLQGRPRLRPIDCYDIVMHASDAVLSGGVRRSATICLFSPDDEEMMKAKTGNWFSENPQRARSNNSAVILKNSADRSIFDKLFLATREFGEPGFCFVDSLEYIYNPCVEIGMCPVLIRDPNGNILQSYTLDLLARQDYFKELGYTYESGWQCCNLTEGNAATISSVEDAYARVKALAIIGTLQAGFTDPGYLRPVSQLIIEREALLGVSMTGLMDNPDFANNLPLLRSLARYAIEINKEISELIGINSAARVTAIKPAGNSTIILGVSGSGCHAVHAHHMIRRVQVNRFDPIYQEFKKHNPHMCEPSVWSANGTDDVISFPLESSPTAITKDDFTALQFLSMVRDLQNNWVRPGVAKPMSCEGLTHNVSNTCIVGPDEWDEVGDFIWENRSSFSGLSLLSKSGDFLYEQAPMQKVWMEQELIEKFGSANLGAAKHVRRFIDGDFFSFRHIMASLKQVLNGVDSREIFGLKAKTERDMLADHSQIVASVMSKKLWDVYQRIRQLIHIDDTDDIITLIASVGNEAEWNRLRKDMKPVDYTAVIETIDITKPVDNVACAGGACEVDFTVQKG